MTGRCITQSHRTDDILHPVQQGMTSNRLLLCGTCTLSRTMTILPGKDMLQCCSDCPMAVNWLLTQVAQVFNPRTDFRFHIHQTSVP